MPLIRTYAATVYVANNQVDDAIRSDRALRGSLQSTFRADFPL